MLTGNVNKGKKILDAPIVMMDSYFVGYWGKGDTWRELCEKMEKRVGKGKELEKQWREEKEAGEKKKAERKVAEEREKTEMLKTLVKWSRTSLVPNRRTKMGKSVKSLLERK